MGERGESSAYGQRKRANAGRKHLDSGFKLEQEKEKA